MDENNVSKVPDAIQYLRWVRLTENSYPQTAITSQTYFGLLYLCMTFSSRNRISHPSKKQRTLFSSKKTFGLGTNTIQTRFNLILRRCAVVKVVGGVETGKQDAPGLDAAPKFGSNLQGVFP